MQLKFTYWKISFLILCSCDSPSQPNSHAVFQECFQEVFFNEILIYTIHKNEFSTKPFYPYRGAVLPASYQQKVADIIDIPLNSGITFYSTHRFFITPILEFFLVRVEDFYDAKSQIIFCLVYDHNEEKFTNKIEVATQYEYEGTSGKATSLIKDVNEDGILDVLTNSFEEHHTNEKSQTYDSLEISVLNEELLFSFFQFNYDTLKQKAGIYSSLYSLEQREWILLNQEIRKKIPRKSSTEKWAIVLMKTATLEEANTIKENYQTTIQTKANLKYDLAKKRLHVYKIDENFLITIDELQNRNSTHLAIGEVKKQIISTAKILDLSKFCMDWKYNCIDKCMYTCN